MEVRLPRLGEGADSGAVARILVKVGDEVKKDQAIIELESDKAVASIPSPQSGKISKVHVKEGDEIKVGQVIVTLEGSNGAAAPKGEKPTEEVAPPSPAKSKVLPLPESPRPAGAEAPTSSMGPAASPSVRKLARDLGIDLTRVRGSERGGRIVMADLRRYIIQLQQQSQPAVPVQPGGPAQIQSRLESMDFSRWGKVDRQKMSKLRQIISTRMVESWTTIPHVTQYDDADITDVLALRKKHAAAYERQGANLTLTPILLHALVPVLKKYPIFNASIDEATGEVVYKQYYHIGIAVDTEQGLIVPVLRDVDRKSILELSIELQQLAQRTCERKVSLDEMQGGTFTISNQGGIGGAHFAPIINKPEVAILGIGRGAVKPIVVGGKVVPRTLLPLALSYDHRLIDGADAARFITALVNAIESVSNDDLKLSGPAKQTSKKGKK